MTTSAIPREASTYDGSVAAPARRERVASIDIVRGIVMLLMAIDHVRVYSGQPAGGPTPGIFFTRWITHFVAPSFVFLAGTGAYLHGRSLGDVKALSRFLLTRGLWLVLLELTVIRVSWTFNVDYAHYVLAGVIWMLGWCMVLMAAVVRLPMRAIAIGGIAIIASHNLLDYLPGGVGGGPIGAVLYGGGGFPLGPGGPPLLVLFVIVPWIAVMMTGYAFGTIMTRPIGERRRFCFRAGSAVTLGFIALRALNGYGDPNHWTSPLQFLATNKYPASLLFLLMTLGPMLIALGVADGATGRIADLLATFGRVPLFYYLLHIPIIHAAACVVSLIRQGSIDPWLFHNHPLVPGPQPDGYRWSLSLLYLVWAICVAVLYAPSRWFARYKATHRDRWLSYF